MTKTYDIAIIGCGPVGALAAHLFAREGLRTLVLEREENPYPLPRAVHLDHEMMRLFQAVGLDEVLAADMCDADGHLHIGADDGMIRYMGAVNAPKPFGWSNDYFFYQPELEDHLRDALGELDNCDLHLGTEFLSLTDHSDGVAITARKKDGEVKYNTRYVVACDGARSTVRKTLDIKLDDLDFEEPWLVVDAEVDGPIKFKHLTGLPDGINLQRLSVMMCDPRRPATIVPGRGNHRRWELMLLPGEDDDEMMQPHKVAELLAPWLEGVDHNIIRAATYRFHGLIAEQWKRGNVFLAGDAAHQTPPFFGQGMCHGLRDVANLAWKFGLVHRGEADETLLSTYQTERDPHVRSVISAAVETGRYICMLDPERAAARDQEIRTRNRERGDMRSAAELIPPIRSGIVARDNKAAGERFIQPRVGDALMDDVTGTGWRLFCMDSDAAEQARHLSLPLDMRVVDVSAIEDDGTLAHWFESRSVRFAILRPDFYVYGTSQDAPEAIVKTLLSQLHDTTRKEVAA